MFKYNEIYSQWINMNLVEYFYISNNLDVSLFNIIAKFNNYNLIINIVETKEEAEKWMKRFISG
jgi:hypothetical protein